MEKASEREREIEHIMHIKVKRMNRSACLCIEYSSA